MRNIVCYHAKCSDGFTAAFVAYLHAKKLGILDSYEFIPTNPKETPLVDVTGCNVVMFDTCLDKEALHKWNELALSFKVIDHHISNQREFGGYNFCKFDMNKSGAGLAWDFYNYGEEAPWWVQYTQDRDLWTWKLPDSKEVSAFLINLDFEFSDYEKLLNMTVDDAINAGRFILAADEVKIRQACKRPIFIDIVGYNVPSVNSGLYQSEIGNRLAALRDEYVVLQNEMYKEFAESPFGIVWYAGVSEKGEKYAQLSFRSIGEFDVSLIAKRFGGGGHANAAGARIPLRQWLNILLQST